MELIKQELVDMESHQLRKDVCPVTAEFEELIKQGLIDDVSCQS